MLRQLNRLASQAIFSACIAVAYFSVACAEEAPVQVALRPSAPVSRSIVRLRDIAEVRGGPPSLRQKLAQLDIAELKPDSSEVISESQVDLRIRLAGIPKHSYQLSGAPSAVVTLRQPASVDEEVLQSLRQPLARHFHVSPEDLALRLTQPLSDDVPTGSEDELRPFVPTHVRPGRIRIDAGVYRRDRLVRILPVSVEAKVFRNVARATRAIGRGANFTEDNVSLERLALSGSDAFNRVPDPLGKTARKSLRSGDLIWADDVLDDAHKPGEYLVKPRDVVQLVVRKKNLTVKLQSAEVLQRGRLGDTVSVRNTQSRRILKGQVVSTKEVVVPL